MCFEEILKHFCCKTKEENNTTTKEKDKPNISLKELLNNINNEDESSNEIFFEKEEIKSQTCKLDFRNGNIYKRRMSKVNNLQN